MKIGIIGNMNNNAHNLVQYLRAEGADAHLLLCDNEASHFLPEADEFDPIDYPIKHLNWGSYRNLYNPRSGARVRADIAPYDLLVGSRLTPAYLYRFANRPLDVFMPTGGDIWTVPVFTDFQLKNLAKYIFFSKMQKEGIRKARRVSMDDLTPEVETITAPLYEKSRRIRCGVPGIFMPSYQGKALERRLSQSKERSRFETLREKADILLIHQVKQLWQKDSVRSFDIYQDKGNDRIFHALAQLKQARPKLKILIIMFEYGSDLAASKSLAKELGVEEMIAWVPRIPRREMMIGMSMVDGMIGELARSWLTYGSVIEAMVLGKPIIHNRKDEDFKGRELYPVLHAETAEDVAKAILRIVEDPQGAKEIGAGGRDWYENETIAPLLRSILELKPLGLGH